MNEVLILYKTKHNTTKQYAFWIHKEIKSNIISLDKVSLKQIQDHDIIVIGSWIFDDKIVAREYIKKNWKTLQNKKIVLFANGLTHPNDEKMEKIFQRSFPKYIQDQIYFFPIGGKLSFEKINIFEKMILKFKKKFRETNEIDSKFIRPIVIKIYSLKFLQE